MDFHIKNLGKPTYKSPLVEGYAGKISAFVEEGKRTFYKTTFFEDKGSRSKIEESFELAGARESIFFNPENTRVAIVTCGGLCPGLNDVIRGIVMECHYRYNVKEILGIKYGYNGLDPDIGYEPVVLTPEIVKDIHQEGGTILCSSRGGGDDMEKLLNRLLELDVQILFTIGGDGTLRGAHELAEYAISKNVPLSVVGIPKTIDNDISYIQRSFGFETAFSKAVESISAAHTEAEGAPNGIGLVKLMGRHSGFIAANATLAMSHVNFLLLPEVSFDLYGDNGFFKHLETRLKNRNHAVIVAAEGAGQDLMDSDLANVKKDASGNVVLNDIGLYLRDKIKAYFKEKKIDINLKYIDPSYIIRSTAATPNDSIFCILLAQFAVHAAMAGKTDMIVGMWNNIYTHVPIEVAISKRKTVNTNSRFWFNILEATGQPLSMKND